MDWITENWFLLVSLALTAIGVWWLMPSTWPRSRAGGVLLALVGSGMIARTLHVASGPLTEAILFWIFAVGAIACGVLMIPSRRSVYAALWFALATLSTCGLFLLQYAPFLAAATITVYAGAIIVMFLFVIMLAQQTRAVVYDTRARQPLAATIVAFILFGAMLYTFEKWDLHAATEIAASERAVITPTPLSRPAPDEPIDTMHALGRSVFGDYLFAVELAGTLLLISAIGAIAMAPRRPEGSL